MHPYYYHDCFDPVSSSIVLPSILTLLFFSSPATCLHVSSDASHVSLPSKGCSHASGYHYLSDRPLDPSKPPLLPINPDPPSNGAIQSYWQILTDVLSSASGSELLAALFHNGIQEACPLHYLHSLFHRFDDIHQIQYRSGYFSRKRIKM